MPVVCPFPGQSVPRTIVDCPGPDACPSGASRVGSAGLAAPAPACLPARTLRHHEPLLRCLLQASRASPGCPSPRTPPTLEGSDGLTQGQRGLGTSERLARCGGLSSPVPAVHSASPMSARESSCCPAADRLPSKGDPCCQRGQQPVKMNSLHGAHRLCPAWGATAPALAEGPCAPPCFPRSPTCPSRGERWTQWMPGQREAWETQSLSLLLLPGDPGDLGWTETAR